MRAAQDKADAVGQAMDSAHVFQATDYAHAAGQVQGVEVMRVDGVTRNSGDGVTVIVRVHGTATRYDNDGQPSGQLDLPVCFRFVYDSEPAKALRGEVTCPAAAPLTVAKDPQLPAGIEDRLRQVLPTGSGVTETAVRRALDGLDLDPAVRRDVTTARGAVGVALRASQYDCVMAAVTAGTVDVWRPARVQLSPGELSCTAAEAAGGEGRTPPH